MLLLRIINNPIQIIASFVIRQTLRSVGLNINYTALFAAIYGAAQTLSRTIGLAPTFRILWNFRGLITQSFPTVRTALTTNSRLNQYGVQTLLTTIQPHWCTTNRNLFPKLNKFYLFWFTLLPFSLFKPILTWFTKFTIGLVFSTIGVLCNETLSNISYLRDGALLITRLFSDYFNFTIPTLNGFTVSKTVEDSSEVIKPNLDKESYTFTFLGLFLLGIVSLIGIICMADHYYPETVSNIPYARGVKESIINTYNSNLEWIQSWNGGADKGKGPDLNSISRESSTDTVRPNSGLKEIWLSDSRWKEKLVRENQLADLKVSGEASTSTAEHIASTTPNNWN